MSRILVSSSPALLPFLAAAILAAGCSSSDSPAASSTPDAASDAGPEASIPDAPGDAAIDSAEEASDAPEAAPPFRSFALFTASDYATTAEFVGVQVSGSDHVPSNLTFDDQDSIVVAAHGRAFVLGRTNGTVSVIDLAQPMTVSATFSVQPAGDGGGKGNPYGVVVPAANKAYVVRYAQNTVAVIDPNASGGVVGEIDLSAFADPADGLIDAFAGVYDPTTGRAYIGLQRIDQNDFGAPPDYVGSCSATHAAIVGIDTATDTIVDLNGTAEGSALELEARNPNYMAWDATTTRVIVFGVGCADPSADGGLGRSGRGVEAVDPAAGTTAWLFHTEELARPAGMIWIPASEALLAFDDDMFTRHWYRWDPTTPSLGSELANVPSVPAYDGKRGLVGVATSTNDGGTSIDLVRFDLDNETLETIAAGAFKAPGVMPYTSATVFP